MPEKEPEAAMTININEFEAFFFDFDGVLADSVEVKTRAFARMFESYGREIETRVVAYHRRHGGMTRVDKFRYFYRELLGRPLDDEKLDGLCRTFADLVVQEVVAAPEISGAAIFLENCQGKLPCFVISAAPEDELRAIIGQRGWTGFFTEICGAPQTKTEHLSRLLGQHGYRPERCLFWGDAESDLRAARACLVNFLAILPGPDAPLLKVAPEVRWIRDFDAIANQRRPADK